MHNARFSHLRAGAVPALCLALAATFLAQAPVPPAINTAEAAIDAENIRAHVRFLADDLLEGRGPGVRGGELAAKYIATQFALDGLKPAGDDGGWFQNVNLVGVQTLPESSMSFK